MADTKVISVNCGCCGGCCLCEWPDEWCFELLQCDIDDGVNTYGMTLGTETVTGVYTAGCITADGLATTGFAHTSDPCSVVLPCNTSMKIVCGEDHNLYASLRITGTLALSFCSSGAAELLTAEVAIPTVECSPILLDTGVQVSTVDGCTITWRFKATTGPC